MQKFFHCFALFSPLPPLATQFMTQHNRRLQRASISTMAIGCHSLTSVLTGPDQVDDVGMLTQLAQDLQLAGKVSVVVL